MIQKYLCIILLCLTKILCNDLKLAQDSHKAKELTDDQIEVISQLSDISNFNKLLDEILIPRVVGTPNHTKVKEFLIAQLEKNDWDVELDTFEDLTPRFGKLEFTNVVGRLNPNAKRYLSLACHYDSKYTREGDFVGATDSAVPCAMMLNLIHVMKPYLDQVKQNDDVSLELIFFDGEEAFNQWSHTDSIYGARHLAAKRHDIRNRPNGLDKMDMLVLLDLLGTPDPMFYSYFMPTEKWYVRLVNAEHRLGKLGLFDNYSNGKPEQRYFQPRSMHAGIEDDHLPFLQRNVPILHIIPIPFPNEWHKSSDNRDAIDIHTIENLNKIFRVFVAEYLHLNV